MRSFRINLVRSIRRSVASTLKVSPIEPWYAVQKVQSNCFVRGIVCSAGRVSCHSSAQSTFKSGIGLQFTNLSAPIALNSNV